MFRNNFFPQKHYGREKRTLADSKKKRGSAKSNVSKVLFPDIGKITNRPTLDLKSFECTASLSQKTLSSVV